MSDSLSGAPESTAELLEAQTTLRATEEHFRLLVESVRDYAIFILDAHGRVATWNIGAQRIKGYAASEIVGRHFSCFYPREEVDAGKCELELEVAAAEGRFEDEGWRERKDGTMFWANVVITALRGERDELIGFAKVTRDLTERRKGEEERIRLAAEQQARVAADAANRAKDGFLAHLSHELRTPLNAILGWAKLLERGLDDERRVRGTRTIVGSAEAMTKLIDDLLDVGRIISGKMRLDIEPIDFAFVVERALDSVRLQAENKGIELRHEVGANVDIVAGDATRLQQIVWNLLTNAIKFTPAGGTVDVALRRDGSFVELIVQDTGIGIAADQLTKVFETFWQEPRATGTTTGLGLGLAICRTLVELHDGRIWAESSGPNRGSRLFVRVPLSAVDSAAGPGGAPSPDRSVAEPSLPQLEEIRVLLVEDEPHARELVRTVLSEQGAVVTEATDVASALAELERCQPDVVLSGIDLPGESGYELIRRIRTLPRLRGGKVPAAAMTAHVRPEDRLRALSAGFTVHVPKPVHPHELVMVVAALTIHVRKRRED